MKPQSLTPPRLAVLLVNLFTVSGPAAPIPGDLLEEFSDLAVNMGVVPARRWYWQQATKTIAYLAGAEFRIKPWVTAFAVAGAILIGWCTSWLIAKAAGALLGRYEVYAYLDAVVFWRIYYAIERLFIPMFMGLVAALTARRSAIAATITLTLLMAGDRGIALVREAAWISRHLPSASYLPLLRSGIIAIFISPMFILIGGIVVRAMRSGKRRSNVHNVNAI